MCYIASISYRRLGKKQKYNIGGSHLNRMYIVYKMGTRFISSGLAERIVLRFYRQNPIRDCLDDSFEGYKYIFEYTFSDVYLLC